MHEKLSVDDEDVNDDAVVACTQLSETNCAVVVPRLLLPFVFRKQHECPRCDAHTAAPNHLHSVPPKQIVSETDEN